MKFAITGGTGFVGRHVASLLLDRGHEVVLIARGVDRRDLSILQRRGVTTVTAGTDNEQLLSQAFAGCDGVAHCAGINREIGEQTYERVHIEGTRHVVHAAKRAGVGKIVLLSFLRARPRCGSGYHESKFAAEEIVRRAAYDGTGPADYTVLKPGVIYGRGDHMLDHLSHAFHTFPVFGLVGLRDQSVRPVAVEDIARIVAASLADGRLSRQTVAITGPEELTLAQAVRRVAKVVGHVPPMVRLPLWFHYAFAWMCERTMKVPLVSLAQVRILSEGLIEPPTACDPLPDDLRPTAPFNEIQIRAGLPAAGSFTWNDCRWSCRHAAA